MNPDELKLRVEKFLENFHLLDKKKQIEILQAESGNPDFWLDHKTAGEKMKELSDLQKEVEEAELLTLWLDEGEYAEAEKLLVKLEKYLYFSGEYDTENAIVSIHSGQGGTEAMDWTEMLFRMYTRYFERKGWSYDVFDETPGEEAGLKSVSITVTGKYAYGY